MFSDKNEKIAMNRHVKADFFRFLGYKEWTIQQAPSEEMVNMKASRACGTHIFSENGLVFGLADL